MNKRELPAYLYWGLPLLIYITPYLINGLGLDAVTRLWGERGIVELGTVLFLIIAGGYTIAAIRLVHSSFQTHPGRIKLIAWLSMIFVGIVYFAGEELSWGQHLFVWDTPSAWAVINNQQETNLHNTHALFDQLPRLILTIAILIGGLFIPLYSNLSALTFASSSLTYWVLPTWVCLPTALCLPLLKLAEHLLTEHFASLGLEVSEGEMKEMLIGLFIMIYTISFYKRSTLYTSSLSGNS